MTMKRARRIAAILALLTVCCGAALHLLPQLASALRIALAALAIVLAAATVYVPVRYHRCPHCGKFIPITARPETCLYCETPLQ